MLDHKLGESMLVSAAPACAPGSTDIACVLNNFDGDIEEIIQHTYEWGRRSAQWSFADYLSDRFSDADVRNVVGGMMALSAYRGLHESFGFTASPAQLEVLDELCEKGFVECDGAEANRRWFITKKGLRMIQPSVVLLQQPRLVFHPREGIALMDYTPFELAAIMTTKGWHWGAWVPPSQRKKDDVAIPDGYAQGDAQVYFTSFKVLPGYLRALLESEERRVAS
jgi:hypothetical protein